MIPSYFIAHGAPSLVLDNNAYTKFLGSSLRNVKPKAIVLFSAHFEEHTQSVGVMETFDTIYDFYGFPDEMYRMTYPAKGTMRLHSKLCLCSTRMGLSAN